MDEILPLVDYHGYSSMKLIIREHNRPKKPRVRVEYLVLMNDVFDGMALFFTKRAY